MFNRIKYNSVPLAVNQLSLQSPNDIFPFEVWELILSKLTYQHFRLVSAVCKDFRDIVNDIMLRIDQYPSLYYGYLFEQGDLIYNELKVKNMSVAQQFSQYRSGMNYHPKYINSASSLCRYIIAGVALSTSTLGAIYLGLANAEACKDNTSVNRTCSVGIELLTGVGSIVLGICALLILFVLVLKAKQSLDQNNKSRSLVRAESDYELLLDQFYKNMYTLEDIYESKLERSNELKSTKDLEVVNLVKSYAYDLERLHSTFNRVATMHDKLRLAEEGYAADSDVEPSAAAAAAYNPRP